MAARLWSLGLVLELALAACAAWVLVWSAGIPEAAAAAGVAAFCALPIAAVSVSVMLARQLSEPRRSGRCTRTVKLVAREALALELAMARMAAQPIRRGASRRAARAARLPVLLVHGLACNGALWWPLLTRLERAQIGPAYAVSLEPLFGDIEGYADALLAPLEALSRAASGRPVAIVAHSMGGLAARALLRRVAPDRIAAIVTLGTPHHGSRLACRFRWPCARQMCPESPWLRDLNEAQEGRLAAPVSSVYSVDDNLICPPESAALAGARMHELRGLGHLGLARSPSVLDLVLAELSRC